MTSGVFLNPLEPNVPFLCPGKCQKTFGFLTNSVVIEKERWLKWFNMHKGLIF